MVKEYRRSLSIWWSFGQEYNGRFFNLQRLLALFLAPCRAHLSFVTVCFARNL